jgi:hypothetical protein
MLLSVPAQAQAPQGQAPASRPRALAGRCGAANWVCVSQCIDITCVERCLAEGCEEALVALARCAHKSGCGPDDSACVARTCGKQCERTFEPAPPSPVKETPDPCAEASVEAGKVPKKMVGRWSLEAASLLPEEKARVVEGTGAADAGVTADGGVVAVADAMPRADYERWLEVKPTGCFVLRSRLEDATLGRGNELEVRRWGTLVVNEKEDTVELRTVSGQAVGPVCGKPRVISLAKGKFENRTYSYEVTKDTLTLTAETPSVQTFQFRRQQPEQGQ